MKLLKLPFLLFITISFQVMGQWIDKNENLNYVKRHECSFVQSGDRFIMFGGREQAKRLDIYNYQNNTWSQGAQAPLEFNHFQATQYDGWVWIIGSFQTNNFPNEVPANNVYLYNPALDIWLKGPSIPQNRRRGGAGLVVRDDKFYVIAGNKKGHNGGYVNQFDVYDPLGNTWNILPNAPKARDHFSAAIINGKLYAASGRLSGGPGGVFAPLVAEVDVYDFNTNSWSTLNSSKNLPTPRAGASVVNFQDELFVIGGEGEQSGPSFKKVEAYNPTTNSWSTKANMKFSRHGTQAIVSGPGIHIAGGSPNRGGGRQHNMEVYQNDAPVGSAIIASKLEALSSVNFSVNESKKIGFSSTNGNAGNFITKVEITGANASDFSIQKDLTNHFVKSGTSQDVEISTNTSTGNKTANLVVTYDNNKKVTVLLKMGSTTGNVQSPFGGTARSIPGIIEAEDYDIGGQDIAYNDTDVENNGPNVAREDEGVDLEARDGGITVGWVANGEWLEYTVDPKSGSYNLEARVATATTGKSIVVKLDNKTLGTFTLPNTQGLGNFQTIKLPNITTLAGNEKILRLEFVGSDINFNWIRFTPSTPNNNGGTNLLKNPGFETGNINSWVGFGTRTVISDAASGSNAVQVTGAASLVQVINGLQPNTEYTLSAQAKVQSGSKVLLGVKEYGGAEKNNSITNTAYQSSSLTFTTGATNTSAKIYFYVASAGNVAFGDDFSVTENNSNASKTISSHDSSIKMFPNPAKNFIKIQGVTKQDNVTIVDNKGRLLTTKNVFDQHNATLDISNLKTGNYFISITNENEKNIFRFIKQ